MFRTYYATCDLTARSARATPAMRCGLIAHAPQFNRKGLTLLDRIDALEQLDGIEHRRGAFWHIQRAGKNAITREQVSRLESIPMTVASLRTPN